MDWSIDKNPLGRSIVNPIRAQGSCGSCWAFSAIVSIEGVCAQNGVLTQLSEQEFVNCSYPEGNEGCNGGFMDSAFKYVILNKGLSLRSSYPYSGIDNDCKVISSHFTRYCPIKNFRDIPENDSHELLHSVSQRVVSAGIEADLTSFRFYKSGIYNDQHCGTNLNHGIALVGYGNDNGQLYWKIKNSWGTDWGERGYMRLARNEEIGSGMCGIAVEASYPIM